MGLDKFEWTDELVKEFAAYYVLTSNKWVRDVDLHTFKQSKQQSIDKKDWEILSFKDIKNDNEYFKLNSKGLYQNNIIQYEYLIETMLLQYPIHSVKRLSDNEVFSIGDKIIGFGECPIIEIKKFEIDYFDNSRIAAYNNEGHGKGHTAWEKVKQPLFTKEQIQEIHHLIENHLKLRGKCH